MKILLNWKMLVAIVVTFALTACGGGGDEYTAPPPLPTPHAISGTINSVSKDVLMVVSSDATQYSDFWVSGPFKYMNATDGTYTFTPSDPNYTFSPTSITLRVSGADYGGVIFFGTYHP